MLSEGTMIQPDPNEHGITLAADDERPTSEDDYFLGVEDAAPRMVGELLDGKYRLEKVLGIGGMGAVYRARHEQIGSTVAIKVLFTHGLRRGELLTRFRREAYAAGATGHANIVKVHDLVTNDDGLSYLVMDYVDGEPLDELIHREGPFSPERAINIAEQILSALHAAHEKGIIHRDVKPENVMISRDEGYEIARVLDFGISKIRPTDADSAALTKTGTILGTPLYMAPEQARGERDLDHRLDLYAVGVMLYTMLAGRPPYEADNYNALLIRVVAGDYQPLDEIGPDLDPHLVDVVAKAMARDRADRFQDGESFIEALRGRTTVEPHRNADQSRKRPRRKGVIVAATVALLIAVAGAFTLLLMTEDSTASDGNSSGIARETTTAAALVPQESVEPQLGEAEAEPISSTVITEETSSSEPETIAVKITTTPPDARVLIAGVEVEDPSEHRVLRTSNERLLVRVEARGYRTAEELYPRDHDIEAHIELDQLPRKRARSVTEERNFRFNLE